MKKIVETAKQIGGDPGDGAQGHGQHRRHLLAALVFLAVSTIFFMPMRWGNPSARVGGADRLLQALAESRAPRSPSHSSRGLRSSPFGAPHWMALSTTTLAGV